MQKFASLQNQRGTPCKRTLLSRCVMRKKHSHCAVAVSTVQAPLTHRFANRIPLVEVPHQLSVHILHLHGSECRDMKLKMRH